MAYLVQLAGVLSLQCRHALDHGAAQLLHLLIVGLLEALQTPLQDALLAVLPLTEGGAHALHSRLQRLADAADGGVVLLGDGVLTGVELSGLSGQLLFEPVFQLFAVGFVQPAGGASAAEEQQRHHQADGHQQDGIQHCEKFHLFYFLKLQNFFGGHGIVTVQAHAVGLHLAALVVVGVAAEAQHRRVKGASKALFATMRPVSRLPK